MSHILCTLAFSISFPSIRLVFFAFSLFIVWSVSVLLLSKDFCIWVLRFNAVTIFFFETSFHYIFLLFWPHAFFFCLFANAIQSSRAYSSWLFCFFPLSFSPIWTLKHRMYIKLSRDLHVFVTSAHMCAKFIFADGNLIHLSYIFTNIWWKSVRENCSLSHSLSITLVCTFRGIKCFVYIFLLSSLSCLFGVCFTFLFFHFNLVECEMSAAAVVDSRANHHRFIFFMCESAFVCKLSARYSEKTVKRKTKASELKMSKMHTYHTQAKTESD